jgi:hypothetical protein
MFSSASSLGSGDFAGGFGTENVDLQEVLDKKN